MTATNDATAERPRWVDDMPYLLTKEWAKPHAVTCRHFDNGATIAVLQMPFGTHLFAADALGCPAAAPARCANCGGEAGEELHIPVEVRIYTSKVHKVDLLYSVSMCAACADINTERRQDWINCVNEAFGRGDLPALARQVASALVEDPAACGVGVDAGHQLAVLDPPTVSALAARIGLDWEEVRSALDALRDGGWLTDGERFETGPTPIRLTIPEA